MTMPDQYVWLFGAGLFLLLWLGFFIAMPGHRRIMLMASLVIMPLGLTEPVFMQSYWTPPSLFDLAGRYGVDIESLIFCFAIAGISVSVLKGWWGFILLPTTDPVRQPQINRRFWFTLATPFVLIPGVYWLWPGNPIYWSLIAMGGGALAAFWCFYEAIPKLMIAGLIFTAIYVIPFFLIEWVAPGYVERIWSLENLSGIALLGLPLEEYLFALFFSLCANGVYLHLLWNRYGRNPVVAEPSATDA